jgi:hypothetical protein
VLSWGEHTCLHFPGPVQERSGVRLSPFLHEKPTGSHSGVYSVSYTITLRGCGVAGLRASVCAASRPGAPPAKGAVARVWGPQKIPATPQPRDYLNVSPDAAHYPLTH